MKHSQTNNLQKVNPKLSEQWHPSKNGKLTPADVTPGSSKKVWWKCKKGHEWETKVCSRSLGTRGCPYCGGKKVCKDNCLAILKPKLAKQWHPSKNGKLTPEESQC